MKYKCIRSFVWSGVRSFQAQAVYNLADEDVKALAAITSRKHPGGCMEFFAPLADARPAGKAPKKDEVPPAPPPPEAPEPPAPPPPAPRAQTEEEAQAEAEAEALPPQPAAEGKADETEAAPADAGADAQAAAPPPAAPRAAVPPPDDDAEPANGPSKEDLKRRAKKLGLKLHGKETYRELWNMIMTAATSGGRRSQPPKGAA